MAMRYNIILSKKEYSQFMHWHKIYPARAWEIKWNQQVAKIQGNLNPYIKDQQN